MMNFICEKISDQIEPSSILHSPSPTSSVSLLANFHKIPIEVDEPALGFHIIKNLAEEK